MISGTITEVSAHDFPPAVLPSQQTQKTTKVSAFVQKFFQKVHERLCFTRGSEFAVRPPLPLRKLVPLCLDLAAAAFGPIDERLTKKVPMINLGLAAIQSIISLRSIGKKVVKGARAIKEQRRLSALINGTEHGLQHPLDPEVRARLEIELQSLHKRMATCKSNIFSLKSLPPSLSNMASCVLTGIHIIAQKVHTVSQAVLSGLRLASAIAGAAAGGFSILIGGIETVLGIRNMRQAYKEKKLVDAKIARLEEQPHPETDIPGPIWGILRTARSIQLTREALKANKHFRLSLMRTCGGALVTVGGALGIGAAFTAGVAATGIAVAALVIGMIGMGVSIGSYLLRRRLKSEMATMKISNQQFNQLIAYIRSPTCTEPQKHEIANLLGLDIHKLTTANIHLPHEFRKVLCTDADTKELAHYLCTGKGSEDQKVKFAQIVDQPVSIIHDRRIFLEHLLADCFKKKKQQIQPHALNDLTVYFRAQHPSQALKEKVSSILGVSSRHLGSPQKVLEGLLVDALITMQVAEEREHPESSPTLLTIDQQQTP